MYPREVVERARALFDAGITVRGVAAQVGIPERTVHHWCVRDRRRPDSRRSSTSACSRCTSATLDRWQYAYLLGSYLGDGHITSGSRTHCLWIYCADVWPGVIRDVQDALEAVLPTSRVSVVQRTGCVAVKSFSNHWTCLFPQHGPGLKHARSIALHEWQSDIVDEMPARFLRGLFHADGCRITNWTVRTVAGVEKRYEYPRWFFSNKSLDILDLCSASLDRLGVAHRRPRWDTISVARREAVEIMDREVGPKS